MKTLLLASALFIGASVTVSAQTAPAATKNTTNTHSSARPGKHSKVAMSDRKEDQLEQDKTEDRKEGIAKDKAEDQKDRMTKDKMEDRKDAINHDKVEDQKERVAKDKKEDRIGKDKIEDKKERSNTHRNRKKEDK